MAELESIGISLDTTSIQTGIRALDVLASKGAPVEQAMGQIEGATAKAGKSLKTLGDGAGKGLDDVAKKAAPAADGLKKVDERADSAAKSVKSLGGAGVAGLDALNKAATVASTGMRSISTASLAADKGIRSLSAAANEVTAAIRAEAAALTGLQSGVAALSAANAAAAKSAQELAISLQAASEQGAKVKKATGASAEAFVGLGGAAKYAGAALAAIGIGTTVSDLVKMADASTNVASRLSLVTTSAAELAQVQRRLFDIAQSSRVSFVDLAGTYAQIARSTKELGVSQSSLLGIIKTVSQAVTISGGSAQSAQAALVQLSQGFAAGALRGEELNSVMEQTPRLAQAIADGLGIGIGKLREMGQAGELTAEKVLGALEKSAAKVEAEFGKMAVTVEQASTQAANSVLRLVGAFDKLSGATSFISGFITKLSQGIDFLSKDVEKLGSQGPLRDAAREVINLDAAAHRLRTGMQSGVLGPNAQAELDRINVRLEEAKRRFNELNAATGGTNPRDQTGFPTRTQSYAAEANRLAAVQAAMGKVINGLSGVKDDFYKDLNSLYAGYKNGLIGLTDYQKQVAKLIKDSGTAKPDAGANAALNDSLAAQVQAYKNADDLIIKNKQAAVEEIARLTKMGAIGELDAVDRTLEIEEAAWAKRKANFDAEIAQAAQKKNSAAEVARISGQAATAEAEYQRTVAKLTDDATAAQYKQLDVLDAIAKKANAAHSSLEGQLYDAKGEAERIGVTGAALGELTKKRVDDAAAALEQQAAAIAIIDPASQAVEALRAQAQAMRDLFKVTGNNSAAQAVYDYGKAVREQNAALQYELSLMGLSEQQRNVLLEQKRIELDLEKQIDAIKARTAADPAKQAELIGKANADAAIAKANATNKVFLDEWKTSVGKYDDIFRQGFADMLNNGKDGWKSFTRSLATTFKTTVADQLYKAFAQPFVVRVVGSMMGMIGSNAAASTGGAASTMGSVGGIMSGVSAATGAFGIGASYGVQSLFANGLGATLSAGGSMIGAGSVASGLGTIAGALGPIAIGVAAIAALAKATKGETRYGFGFEADAAGKVFTTVNENGGAGGEGAQKSAAQAAFDTVNSVLKQYGSALVAENIKAGLTTSGKGRGGVFAQFALSDGTTVGRDFDTRIDTSLNAEEAVKAYALELNKATVLALQSATDLPQYVQRQLSGVDVESLDLDAVTKLLTDVASLPSALLQQYGTTRDALVQTFTQGLAAGDATAAGQAVADTLVASIQQSLYTSAAGQIFDTVNAGIVAPMLDAIATGASVSEALSQAAIDKTIERAKAQATALTELFSNADFVDALSQIRTTVGSALGQSASMLPAYPVAAATELAGAATSADTAAQDAKRAWDQITDSLKSDSAQLQIDLLRAQGQEEAAVAAERARAIEGYDAYQTALYDSNQALRTQIAGLERAAQLTAEMGELLPSVLSAYGNTAGAERLRYGSIAADIIKAGLSGLSQDDLTRELMGASKEQIAAVAEQIYSLGTTSDEARVALLRAAGGLAELKDSAQAAALQNVDTAYSALERAVAAQRTVLQEAITDVRAVFDAVRSASRDLFGQVDSAMQANAEQARGFITQALSSARLTGYLPEPDQLNEAISAARAGLDAKVYASQSEVDFQRLVLANELRDLQDISGDQLTEAEKQLKALDDVLDAAQQQVNALKGIDASVMTVESAVRALSDSIAAAMGAKPGAAGAGATSAKKTPTDLQGANGAYYSVATDTGYLAGSGLPWLGSDVRDAAMALYEAGNTKAIYDAIAGSGFSLAQADTILGLQPGAAEEWAKSVGLPVFHEGTNYVPKTGLALLEQGEAVVPRAFNPSAMAGSDNTELVAELRALRAEVTELRRQVDVTNTNTARTADAVNGRPEAPMLVEAVA